MRLRSNRSNTICKLIILSRFGKGIINKSDSLSLCIFVLVSANCKFVFTLFSASPLTVVFLLLQLLLLIWFIHFGMFNRFFDLQQQQSGSQSDTVSPALSPSLFGLVGCDRLLLVNDIYSFLFCFFFFFVALALAAI